MDIGETHDVQKNDLLEYKASSSKYGLLKSRNLFRQKDEQLSRCGKWLKFVRSSPKVSCEVSTLPSPSHFLSKVVENYEGESRIRSYQSEKMHKKVSKTFSSPSIDFSQGTLQFTMRANGTPRFVFKLENQKGIYVASLSSNVNDQSGLDYSYMIHLQSRESSSSSSSSSSHLVGRIKVSTSSFGREFVLFNSSNGEHQFSKKNRGLSKKVKNNQSTSRLTCSWDRKPKEPSFENNFATNLEALAVVVKQEYPEEEVGGWGLKFLKKSRLLHTNAANETSRGLISMDVVIPLGIHGGPEDGPLSLIQRWKSRGECDCGGWDLGCSLTVLKGRPRKDHFELFMEGSKHETIALRIVKDGGGLYLVQFSTKISVLHSFSIALAFIHSHSQKLQKLHL